MSSSSRSSLGCRTSIRTVHQRLALLLLVLVAAASALSSSCVVEHPQPPPLTVVSHSPKGAREDDDAPLRIQFDQPAVLEDQVGIPLTDVPAKLSPNAALSGVWLDTRTLVLHSKTLAPATRYTLELSAELARRAGDFSFSFVNLPLLAKGVNGVDVTRLPTLPTLPLTFSAPVLPVQASASCRILATDGTEIRLTHDTSIEERSTTVVLHPERPLASGTSYRLNCQGLGVVRGVDAVQEDFELALQTYPVLSVVRAVPEGWDAPSDEVTVELEFSNPVTLDDVRERIALSPEVPTVNRGYLDETGTIYRAVVDLKPETPYVLQMRAGLVDVYGQQLASAHEHRFTTGHAQPRLVLETGIFAVEPQPGSYPIWTRNLKQFSVHCAAVPRQQVVALLTSELDYDPWYAASSTVDWNKHGMQATERSITIDSPKNNWHLERLPLSSLCGKPGKRASGTPGTKGLYLAELSSAEVPQQEWRSGSRRVLANVTDMGVFMKAGTGSGIVWVTSMSSGAPLPDVAVELYSPQGTKVFQGKTDARGILRTPGSNELLKQPGADETDPEAWDMYSYRSQRMIAVASKGDDFAVVDGNWANGIQTWNFGVPEERAAGKVAIRGFIQSDRGIYRPGESVHFKGLVRAIALGRAPAVPADKEVQIVVEDSVGATLFEGKRTLSAFGGFHFDLPLAKEAKLGDYHVRASIDQQTFRERFFVEEFRTLDYEVEIRSKSDHVQVGDKLTAEVRADYLFGAPLKGAKVEWNVRRREHDVFFQRYAQYSFSDSARHGYRDWWWEDRDNYASHVADGEGSTDGEGVFALEVHDAQTQFTGPQDYLVGVAVTDASDQTVSKQKVVTAHRSEFYLGLHTQEWLQAVNMPFSVNAIAVDPDGKRVAANATLKFVRLEYDCTTHRGYRSYSSCKERPVTMLTRPFKIPATGASTQRIVPKQPGDYVIRVEAKDGKGNDVTASQFSFVVGRGEAFWSGDESARMTLVASKQEYAPGESAKLLPRTNLTQAHALVTLERNGVLEAAVHRLERASDGLEVSLNESHGPNVWASVAMVSGRSGPGDAERPRFKLGLVELKVKTDNQRLKVEVTPDKEQYEPGEQVHGTIRVTSRGVPVRSELSLSVADEGILQLIAYQTPDPMNSFYKSWGLGTDASTNWNRLSRLNDPGSIDPDEGGDSGSNDGQRIRSNFVSSAYWAPALLTDERGIAEFSFKAPDNLTAFRMMVAAADAGARFGAGDQRIRIKKPLLLEPVLPRFLTEGDQAEVGVVVHNYTGKAGTVTLLASSTGATLERTPQVLTIGKDAVVRARFVARAMSQERAEFTFSAKMGPFDDALRLSLPIGRAHQLRTRVLHEGVIDEHGGKLDLPVGFTKGAVLDDSRIVVNTDRSGMGELIPGLRYLVQYPYGCLEQTLSKFIPLAKFRDLTRSLGDTALEGTRSDAFIRAGAAKVVRHQHADGHFSLWPSGPTYPHLTAYATFGLLEAKRAGVEVDDSAITRGASALRTWANERVGQGIHGGELASVAMAAFVLAESGRADAGLNAKLFELRRGLPRYGMAFLLRALAKKGSPTATATLKAELIDRVQQSHSTAKVVETGDLREYMSSDVRSTALTLMALLETEPSHPITHKLAEGLRAERLSHGAWRSTQDNIYALTALAAYARGLESGQVTTTVKLGNSAPEQQQLTGLQLSSISRGGRELNGSSVTLTSTGRLRYSVQVTEAIPIDLAKTENNGFELTRQYLEPETDKPLTTFAAGQLVKVRLDYRSNGRQRYVALEDPLPAGFEILNTKLATSKTQTDVTGPGWNWTHTEARDDRYLAFADWLYHDTGRLEYLVRATIPGNFQALPAHIEAMYEPEINGRTQATRVRVDAAPTSKKAETSSPTSNASPSHASLAAQEQNP